MSNANNDPQTNTEAQAQVAVGQMIHSLSISIYERAVARQMGLDEESMQQLARASVTAARAYFVGVGAIRPASPIAQP
jgi:hypothetical protein